MCIWCHGSGSTTALEYSIFFLCINILISNLVSFRGEEGFAFKFSTIFPSFTPLGFVELIQSRACSADSDQHADSATAGKKDFVQHLPCSR